MKSLNKARKMTHSEFARYLSSIDIFQGNRYAKLKGEALAIATEGIVRHLRACRNMDVPINVPAIKEVIDDALNGRKVFAEVSTDTAKL